MFNFKEELGRAEWKAELEGLQAPLIPREGREGMEMRERPAKLWTINFLIASIQKPSAIAYTTIIPLPAVIMQRPFFQ